MQKLRIGIAGAGQVARQRHLEAYRRNARARVVAIYDPNKPREALAREFGVTAAFSNAEEFFAQDLDLVSICAPPMVHTQLIETALKSGTHVFSEKPMTLTSTDGQRMETLAAENNLVLCPCHNFLFTDAMNKAKALVRDNKLGEVLGITAVQWSSWNRRLPSWHEELPGGLFFDEGPHLVYLIRHFLGELEVKQASHVRDEMGSDNKNSRFDIVLQGERGWGSITKWFGAPQSEWMLAIGFTRGTLILDLYRNTLIALPPEKARNYKYILEIPARSTSQMWRSIFRWSIHRLTRGRYLHGHEELVSQLVESIVAGREPPVTAYDGWKVVEFLEAAVSKALKSHSVNG